MAEKEMLQKALIYALEKTAVPLRPIVYSQKNYREIFGNGKIETPIDTLKFGEGQFIKLAPFNRNYLLGAIHETLTNPSLVVNAIGVDHTTEKMSPCDIYSKSFIYQSGNKRVVDSIVVFKGKHSVIISSHPDSIEKLVKEIKTADNLAYASKDVSRATVEFLNSHAVKDGADQLSSERIKSVVAFTNSSYNENAKLSIEKLVDSGKIEEGYLEITNENFQEYFNIFNKHFSYANKPQKIVNEFFSKGIKNENKQEMKQWLESQGYKITSVRKNSKNSFDRVVGVGVAPTISRLRQVEGYEPATRLRPSPTTDYSIQGKKDMSTEKTKKLDTLNSPLSVNADGKTSYYSPAAEQFKSVNDKNLENNIKSLSANDIGTADETITISEHTPFVLKNLKAHNFEDKKVAIYKDKLARGLFLSEKERHGHNNSITKENVIETFNNIANPRAVLLSKDNSSLIGVYDIADKKNEPMMISFKSGNGHIEANLMTSIYGKPEKDIEYWIDNGQLLYVNDMEKEKAFTLPSRQLRISDINAYALNIQAKSEFVNNNSNEKENIMNGEAKELDLTNNSEYFEAEDWVNVKTGRIKAEQGYSTEDSLVDLKQMVEQGFYNNELDDEKFREKVVAVIDAKQKEFEQQNSNKEKNNINKTNKDLANKAKVFIDFDNKRITQMYYNGDSPEGGYFVRLENSLEQLADVLEQKATVDFDTELEAIADSYPIHRKNEDPLGYKDDLTYFETGGVNNEGDYEHDFNIEYDFTDNDAKRNAAIEIAGKIAEEFAGRNFGEVDFFNSIKEAINGDTRKLESLEMEERFGRIHRINTGSESQHDLDRTTDRMFDNMEWLGDEFRYTIYPDDSTFKLFVGEGIEEFCENRNIPSDFMANRIEVSMMDGKVEAFYLIDAEGQNVFEKDVKDELFFDGSSAYTPAMLKEFRKDVLPELQKEASMARNNNSAAQEQTPQTPEFLAATVQETFSENEKEKNMNDSYKPLYEKFIENRYQPQQGHADGIAVSDRHWKIWDTVLNRSGANGAFFESKKEAAEKEAAEMNSKCRAEYEETISKTYEGHGAYTAHVFGGYLGSRSELSMMGAIIDDLTDETYETLNKDKKHMLATGILESECPSLAFNTSNWAKQNGMEVSPKTVLALVPGGLRKTEKETQQLSRLGVLAYNLKTSFVAQLEGSEPEYALAIDYAQKHGLPCYVKDNELARSIAENLPFVRFCADENAVIEAVREDTLSKEEQKQAYLSKYNAPVSDAPMQSVQSLEQFFDREFSSAELVRAIEEMGFYSDEIKPAYGLENDPNAERTYVFGTLAANAIIDIHEEKGMRLNDEAAEEIYKIGIEVAQNKYGSYRELETTRLEKVFGSEKNVRPYSKDMHNLEKALESFYSQQSQTQDGKVAGVFTNVWVDNWRIISPLTNENGYPINESTITYKGVESIKCADGEVVCVNSKALEDAKLNVGDVLKTIADANDLRCPQLDDVYKPSQSYYIDKMNFKEREFYKNPPYPGFAEQMERVKEMARSHFENGSNEMLKGYKPVMVLPTSRHPDDKDLSCVMAKSEKTGKYAVWTSFNTDTKGYENTDYGASGSLNHGHYDIRSLNDAAKIMCAVSNSRPLRIEHTQQIKRGNDVER